MIETLFWGIILIISTAFTAIVVVLGIYFATTKTKKKEIEVKSKDYRLEEQKEIV